MNKRQILASLNKIADQLDNNGLFTEANTITNVMIKVADEPKLDPVLLAEGGLQAFLDRNSPMGPTRGGNYDFNNEPNLSDFDDEDEREDCCPNCGNCDERLASDPSVIILGRFSNGVVAWCQNDNCSYDYWQDSKEGTEDPVCPLCSSDLFFDDPNDPYRLMHCDNTECNAVFKDGLEVKQ